MFREHVMLGNDLLFKCGIPSYVGDFVSVLSWHDSEGRDFFASRHYGKGTLRLHTNIIMLFAWVAIAIAFICE